MNIALYVVAAYLISFGLVMTTENFRSSIFFKILPFLSGILVLFEALTNSGYIING